MDRRKLTIIGCIAALIGTALLSYPIIANLYYESVQQELIDFYSQKENEKRDAEQNNTAKPNLDKNEELEACRAYNSSLLEQDRQLTDPFDRERKNTDTEDTLYAELLSSGDDSSMGIIEIPAIDCRLVIYHGTEEAALAKGAGHLKGTSLPVGGRGSHAVLSAHAGLPGRRLFTDLDMLDTGDLFYIHTLGMTLAYEVDQILTVLPGQDDALCIDKDRDYVTLVTCTPYGVNSHRLLVRGIRTTYEAPSTSAPQSEPRRAGSTWIRKYLIAVFSGALIFIAALSVYFIFKKFKK